MKLRRSDIARLTSWSGSIFEKGSITSNGRNATRRATPGASCVGTKPAATATAVRCSDFGRPINEPMVFNSAWEGRAIAGFKRIGQVCGRMHDPSFNARNVACQRLPTRLTGPPRFIGVPGRTPTPGAPTPGVTTARATGRGRSTTPGLTTHPTGYATYWQYTTALACSVLAATNPVISNADNAIESFILASSIRNL
jgi:hypothetical protein